MRISSNLSNNFNERRGNTSSPSPHLSMMSISRANNRLAYLRSEYVNDQDAHFNQLNQKMMLKPSRRPRFNAAALSSAENAFGPTNCNLRINTFYKAPVGKETLAVKHIQPRPASINAVTEPDLPVRKITSKYQPVYRRLPVMRPKIKPVPSRFASNVIRNHYRTQDMMD